MSMIRGEIQLNREVVSRRISVGGEAPFRRMDNGEWVNRTHPENRVESITLADVLGTRPQQDDQQNRDRS